MRFRHTLATLLLAAGGALPVAGQSELDAAGLGERAELGEPQGVAWTGPELDRETEEVASLMRCPVCQGLSVADSPTLSAIAMKNQVRQLLAEGYTRQQILDHFETSYGEFIRLAPKARGFNLLVWITPVVSLLLGAWLVVRRFRRERQAAPSAPDPELASYLEQVREEVTP